jgi:hypothetical protein
VTRKGGGSDRVKPKAASGLSEREKGEENVEMRGGGRLNIDKDAFRNIC